MNLIRKRFVLGAGLCLTLHFAHAQYQKIDSLQNLLNRADDTVKANIQNSIARSLISVNGDKALQSAKESLTLSRTLGFQNGELDALRTISDIYIRKGDLKNALSTNKEAVAIAIAIGDKSKIAVAKGYLGMNYRYLNYHSKAFESLTEAIDIFRELGDRDNEASFNLSIGNIYLNEKDYTTARKYYQKAIDLSGEDQTLRHVVYINLGEIDQEEKNYAQSLKTLDKALSFFENQKHVMYVAYILYLKGKAYVQLNEHERASSYYQHAITLYQGLQNTSGQARCLIELGKMDLSQQKFDAALENFNRALSLARTQQKYEHLEKIYLGLVASYQGKGAYKESLENQILAGVCKDSLRSIAQREKLTELQARYENDISEKEILQLKAERKDYYIMMALLALLLIASSVIIFLLFRRQKVSIRRAEFNRQRLHVELQEKEQINKNLEAELQFKVKELTSFTLNMIQKKEILEGVKKGMEEIREQTDGEARTKLNRILSTINLSQRLDRDWDNFKLYFEQVHQGFFDDLTTNYPELNSNDIRLCALLRLNLDTKQIASVMDIAPESAKVAKHRIRKKLGLSNTDNLHLFFANIGTPTAVKSA